MTKKLHQVAVRHAVGAAVLLTCSMAASAQTESAAAPASSPTAEKLDTVLITATRRREPAREVPLQVDVLSAADLQKTGAKTLAEALSNEPGVTVKTGTGAGSNSVTIRGISAGDEVASLVGIYVDDVAVGSSSAWVAGSRNGFDMNLLDLNHIEVLKGPQGTLYGASSMGGLLKYVTNTPDSYELSGSVSVGASKIKDGGSGNTVSGVVNMPIREGVAALRVSGYSDKAAGYINDVGGAPLTEANRGDSHGVRVAALIEPSNKFHIRLSAMSESIHRDGTSWVNYSGTTKQPVKGPFTGQQEVLQPSDSKTTLFSADIEYDMGWARFNSISSTQRRTAQTVIDSSIYTALLPGYGIKTVAALNDIGLRRDTQEFRLTSQAGHEIAWIAGLYYNDETGKNLQNLPTTFITGTAGPDLLAASLPSSFRETAAYGDVTWNPMKKLSITAGVRVARSKQRLDGISNGLLAGGAHNVTNSSEETASTYLATARYALTPESNVYLRAASGYRPGGPNTPIYDTAGHLLVPATYKHDSLWSYEAGYKADLLNKTLAVSASVFDIQWKDLQQYGVAQGLSYLTNAGKAESKGAEFSATYVLAQDWKLSAAATYTDGKTKEVSPFAAAGVPLPNSPKLSASLAATYNFNVAGLPSFVGLSERYIGLRHAGFVGSSVSPDLVLPSYSITDLQAGVDLKRVQLGFYVRNLFNKRAELGASSTLVKLGGSWLVNVQQPMTMGVTLTAPF